MCIRDRDGAIGKIFSSIEPTLVRKPSINSAGDGYVEAKLEEYNFRNTTNDPKFASTLIKKDQQFRYIGFQFDLTEEQAKTLEPKIQHIKDLVTFFGGTLYEDTIEEDSEESDDNTDAHDITEDKSTTDTMAKRANLKNSIQETFVEDIENEDPNLTHSDFFINDEDFTDDDSSSIEDTTDAEHSSDDYDSDAGDSTSTVDIDQDLSNLYIDDKIPTPPQSSKTTRKSTEQYITELRERNAKKAKALDERYRSFCLRQNKSF